MTDKPYTDADVELVAAAMWRAGAPERHSRAEVARIALDAPAAAGRLAPADDDPRHVIEFRADGWTIKHPLACRIGDLFGCRVNLAAEDLDGPPAPVGRYAVTVDSIDGQLRIGERVDQADDCPCLPAAPPHVHGAGGYSTAAETTAQTHHVIAFDAAGTWSLEHPLGCRQAELDFDCPVRLLAERQITSDLAQLMAGGRYACSVGEVGDVFQLDERLHDDQCTTPVCAACGCWCHAEEQAEG